jgi:hypothetical protein
MKRHCSDKERNTYMFFRSLLTSSTTKKTLFTYFSDLLSYKEGLFTLHAALTHHILQTPASFFIDAIERERGIELKD